MLFTWNSVVVRKSCSFCNKSEIFSSIPRQSKRKCSIQRNLKSASFLSKLVTTAEALLFSVAILFRCTVARLQFPQCTKITNIWSPSYFCVLVWRLAAMCFSCCTIFGNTNRIYKTFSELNQVHQYILDVLLKTIRLMLTSLQVNEHRLNGLCSA